MKYWIFIFISFNSNAQNLQTFSILPSLGGIDDKCYVNFIALDSSKIYTLGTILTVQDSNIRNKIWENQIATFDYRGSIIDTKLLNDSSLGLNRLYANNPLVKINDSIYFTTILIDNLNKRYSELEAVIIDFKNGRILKNNRIPQPYIGDFDFFHYCKAHFNKGKINIIFEVYINNSIDDGRYFMYEIDTSLNFFKIDSLGKFNQKMTFFWVAKNEKNEFEFVGQASKIKDNTVTPEGNLFYIKMDSTFKILKRKDYVGNFNYGFVTADNYTILRNEDGTWVMSVYDWVITKEPDPNYGKPTTLKFSPEFDSLIWKRSMYEKHSNVHLVRSWIYYADKMKDGSGYITAGDQYDQRVDSLENYAVLYKVSENGDSLWTRKYIPLGWSKERTAGTRISQVKVSDYNTIIMAGIAGDRDQNNAVRAWLLHLDNDGCLVPGCNTTTKDIINKKEKKFKIYPNPIISGELYLLSRISSNEKYNFSLLDLQGKEIYTTDFLPIEGAQYFIEIPSELAPGTYILKIENGTEIQNEKIIIQ